tara:strand:- start:2442 stop:2936 length:495 start_codon:yes stop_codon:yes gene_type:complete
MTQDLNHMKTDVALIKKDIKNIEQFFSKFDYIVEMTAERDKNMAVQVEILKGVGEKIEQLDFKIEEHKQDAAKALAVVHDRLEMYRRSSREDHERLSSHSAQSRRERNEEIMEALSKLNGSLDKRISDMETKVTTLDRWKWWVMGFGAVIVFIISRIDFSSFIG